MSPLECVAESYGVLGFTQETIERLPPSLALFFLYATRCCQEPPPDWSSEAYTLIGREDLAELHTQTSSRKKHVPTTPTNRLGLAPVAGDGDGDDAEDGMEGLDMEVCR